MFRSLNSPKLRASLELDRWRRQRASQDNGIPPMRQSCASVRVGSKLYLFGGVGAGKSRFNSLYVLDLEIFKWRRIDDCLGPVPKPRSRHSLNTDGEKKIWLYGGEGSFEGESCTGNTRSLREVYGGLFEFDVGTCTWKRMHVDGFSATGLNCLPLPRRGHTSTIVLPSDDNPALQMLMFGGAGPERTKGRDTFLNDIWQLELHGGDRGGTWRELQPSGVPPKPRAGHTSTKIGNKFYVYGGISEKDGVLDDLYMYDIHNMHWNKINIAGSNPGGLYGHSATQHPWFKNKIYVFGGKKGYGEEPDEKLWILDTERRTWSSPGTTGQSPPARYGHSMASLNKALLLFGGSNATGYCSAKDIYILECVPSLGIGKKTSSVISPLSASSRTCTQGPLHAETGKEQANVAEIDSCALAEITYPGLAEGIQRWQKRTQHQRMLGYKSRSKRSLGREMRNNKTTECDDGRQLNKKTSFLPVSNYLEFKTRMGKPIRKKQEGVSLINKSSNDLFVGSRGLNSQKNSSRTNDSKSPPPRFLSSRRPRTASPDPLLSVRSGGRLDRIRGLPAGLRPIGFDSIISESTSPNSQTSPRSIFSFSMFDHYDRMRPATTSIISLGSRSRAIWNVPTKQQPGALDKLQPMRRPVPMTSSNLVRLKRQQSLLASRPQ